jgi:hypothetical protein
MAVMELVAASGANVDARDETQGTLLMSFAGQGKAEPVQWLLPHCADRNARNKSEKTGAEIGREHEGRLLTKYARLYDVRLSLFAPLACRDAARGSGAPGSPRHRPATADAGHLRRLLVPSFGVAGSPADAD